MSIMDYTVKCSINMMEIHMHCPSVQVIIPLMIWESTEFSKPVLAVVLVCSLAIFPMFILPSGPSMWLSGMMFGYGLGFLIIMSGTMIGQTLPYFIGQWLLHDRIQVSTCVIVITCLSAFNFITLSKSCLSSLILEQPVSWKLVNYMSI